jgi:hypothetical protein
MAENRAGERVFEKGHLVWRLNGKVNMRLSDESGEIIFLDNEDR